MLKKLILATIASLVLVSGLATAAPPERQRFYLDISTSIDAGLHSGTIKNTNKQKRVVFQVGDGSPMSVPFTLEAFWQSATIYNVSGKLGEHCFEDPAHVLGAIHISETKSEEAKAQFWFDSTYTESGTEVRYLLTLTADYWSVDDGGITEGVFPPTIIVASETALPVLDSAVYMLATKWTMGTEGKGRYRNDSCKGSGDFPPLNRPLLIVNQIALDYVDPP